MTRNIYRPIRQALLLLSLSFLSWSCNDDFQAPDQYHGQCMTLTAECGEMLPQFIDPTDLQSRAGDAKDKEEKEINTLHVFFFDSKSDASGKHPLLVPGDVEFKPYQCLTTNILAVPELEKIFQQGTGDIIVRALANLSGKDASGNIVDPTALRFYTEYSKDEENVVFIKGTHRGDGADGEPELYEITCLEDLNDWVYCPVLRSEEETTIDKLPKAGMPMVGERTIKPSDYGGATGTNLKIPMKAMMARIDLKIKLDPDNVNSALGLPKMTITGYGVMNMPTRVPFTPRNGGGYNAPADTTDQPLEKELVKEEVNTITKDQEVRFRYYTYENVRQPNWNAKRTDESAAYDLSVDPPVVNYPNGVTKDEQKQRWKPTIARKWSASAIIIRGQYVTHQNLTYNAQFTIYIGDNTVDDFKVCRNRQYVNNITIKGLDYVRNSDDGVYTFDGRVNVVTDNPVYISVVNERKVDAHASVLPMDFFFMRTFDPDKGEEEPNSEVEISLVDPNNPDRTPRWLRMEKIPGEAMRTGVYRTEEEDFIQGMEGIPYSPGTGARKYFLYNLVNDILKDNTSTVIKRRSDGSRTRVYFYIDENVPETKQPSGQNWPDRMATVYVTYRLRDNEGNVIEERPRTIDIEQRGLLRVESTANNRNMDFYIEYYEEYMAHNDPLDMHDIPGQVYDGLQWCKPASDFNNGSVSFATDGNRGGGIIADPSGYRGWLQTKGYVSYIALGSEAANTRYRSYHIYGERDGYWMTDYMVNGREGRRPLTMVKTYNRTLDEQPPTAFHYCYGKNKREADGEVYKTGKTGYWYMPGITELEKAMEKYYQQFPEFHDNLYWSASSAKSGNNSEDINCARATNVDDNGNHIASDNNSPVGTPENLSTGRRPRDFSHRIRATYIVL